MADILLCILVENARNLSPPVAEKKSIWSSARFIPVYIAYPVRNAPLARMFVRQRNEQKRLLNQHPTSRGNSDYNTHQCLGMHSVVDIEKHPLSGLSLPRPLSPSVTVERLLIHKYMQWLQGNSLLSLEGIMIWRWILTEFKHDVNVAAVPLITTECDCECCDWKWGCRGLRLITTTCS